MTDSHLNNAIAHLERLVVEKKEELIERYEKKIEAISRNIARVGLLMLIATLQAIALGGNHQQHRIYSGFSGSYFYWQRNSIVWFAPLSLLDLVWLAHIVINFGGRKTKYT